MKVFQSTLLIFLVMVGPLSSDHLGGQGPYDRVLGAADEPENGLTYNGTDSSER